MHNRRNESSSSTRGDQPSPVIAAITRTRRNELQCSNLANTREHLRVVIERRVDRVCTRCGIGLAASGEHHGGAHDVVMLPPVTNEPCSSIEHRLESVQEARRRAGCCSGPPEKRQKRRQLPSQPQEAAT